MRWNPSQIFTCVRDTQCRTKNWISRQRENWPKDSNLRATSGRSFFTTTRRLTQKRWPKPSWILLAFRFCHTHQTWQLLFSSSSVFTSNSSWKKSGKWRPGKKYKTNLQSLAIQHGNIAVKNVKVSTRWNALRVCPLAFGHPDWVVTP